MKRLLVCILFMALPLVACVKKQEVKSGPDVVIEGLQSSGLEVGEPDETGMQTLFINKNISLQMPRVWKRVPNEKLLKSPMRSLISVEGMVFNGVYTGAPTNDLRSPFFIASTVAMKKKVSKTELYILMDNELFAPSFLKDVDIPFVIHNREFVDSKKMILYELTLSPPNRPPYEGVMAIVFTKEGVSFLFGLCSGRDSYTLSSLKIGFLSTSVASKVLYK